MRPWRRHCPSLRQRRGQQKGPVVMDAENFCRLPDEIGLRVLERAVDWTGDEGPVELGKLEALFYALTDAIKGSLAAPQDAARFRRTLAGAVVTLDRGELRVERAPPRRARPRGPPRNGLNQTRTSGTKVRQAVVKQARMPWIRGPFRQG